jgi:ribosomal protein L21
MNARLRTATKLLNSPFDGIRTNVCIRRIESRRRIETRATTVAGTRRLTTVQHFPLPNAIPLTDSKPATPSPLSKESPLAPLLNTSNLYMTVHVNSFPYLISPNDTLHLPFHLPDVALGSILRMTQVSRIGVRDYTLQGQPYVDERVFTLKMRVIEHTKMPLVTTIKTKQRQRRARHLFNKQNYTVLK